MNSIVEGSSGRSRCLFRSPVMIMRVVYDDNHARNVANSVKNWADVGWDPGRYTAATTCDGPVDDEMRATNSSNVMILPMLADDWIFETRTPPCVSSATPKWFIKLTSSIFFEWGIGRACSSTCRPSERSRLMHDASASSWVSVTARRLMFLFLEDLSQRQPCYLLSGSFSEPQWSNRSMQPVWRWVTGSTMLTDLRGDDCDVRLLTL